MLASFQSAFRRAIWPRFHAKDEHMHKEDGHGTHGKSLGDMPPELLMCIVHFTWHNAFLNHEPLIWSRDLMNLCLTSKWLQAVSEQSLYQAFFHLKTPHRVSELLETVTKHPHLCRYIKSIAVKLFTGNVIVPPRRAVFLRYLKAISRLKIQDHHFRDQLVRGLRAGSHDAEVALLLMLATNVRILWLSCCEWQDTTTDTSQHDDHDNGTSLVLETLSQCTTGRLAGVLTRVYHAEFHLMPDFNDSYDSGDSDDSVETQLLPSETISPFLALPAITSFKATCLTRLSPNVCWVSMASNVSCITLDECHLDTSGICAVLDACSTLSDVRIEWALEDPDQSHAVIRIDFAQIVHTLRRHTRTLKSLRLDTTDHGALTIATHLPSLCDFTNLGTLKIEEALLYGDNYRTVWWEPPAENEDLRAALDSILPAQLTELALYTRKHFSLFHEMIHATAATGVASQGQLEAFTISFPLIDSVLSDEDEVIIASVRDNMQAGCTEVKMPFRAEICDDHFQNLEEIVYTFSAQQHLAQTMLSLTK